MLLELDILSCLYIFLVFKFNIFEYGMAFLFIKKLNKLSSIKIIYHYINCFKYGGMIFGGICLLYFGGYENKNSSKILRVYNIIYFFCSLILLFCSYLFFLFQ